MIQAILTDIEGTTSSIAFVKDVLFPYARARMATFIAEHGTEPEVASLIAETCTIAGISLDPEAAAVQLVAWIDEDRKAAPLKALQGMIWEEGYRRGDFHGHIYEDAVRKLRDWQAAGLALYVFSSGSVQAQKLLFAHTEFGDLTPLFSGYFDTRTGPKQVADAYREIARQIDVAPENVLFLSDIGAELAAARAAGFQTCLLVRGEPPEYGDIHVIARNFDEIAIPA